jgi:hypothetical protein
MAFIGNVSTSAKTDSFSLVENAPSTIFQRTAATPKPMQGTSWTTTCPGYTPVYSVNHKRTYNDVELIAAPNAGKHRCYLTGIGGDWVKTNVSGTVQPYAQIYLSGDSTRLRVVSPVGADTVFAEASCFQIRPWSDQLTCSNRMRQDAHGFLR